jgi:hypothetical protein
VHHRAIVPEQVRKRVAEQRFRSRRGREYAIDVTSVSKCAGVVYTSNTVTNAVKGPTTIAVTP